MSLPNIDQALASCAIIQAIFIDSSCDSEFSPLGRFTDILIPKTYDVVERIITLNTILVGYLHR
jgi:hypothetical protein